MGNLYSNFMKDYEKNSIILNKTSIKNYDFENKYAEITTSKPIDNWKDSKNKNVYAGNIIILIYNNDKKEKLICCIHAYTWDNYIDIERKGIIKNISFHTDVMNRFDLLDKGSIIKFNCKINLDYINYTFQAYTNFSKFDIFHKQLIYNATPKQHVTIIF